MPTVNYLQNSITSQLVGMECGQCGISFAITQEKYDRCNDRGENFYCPNGHCRVFCKSEVAKLEEALARERRKGDNLKCDLNNEQYYRKHAENQVRAERGAKTKLKKRIAAGVCPCCRRHFTNVERHIKCKHPDYSKK